jgi:hypothetical protein
MESPHYNLPLYLGGDNPNIPKPADLHDKTFPQKCRHSVSRFFQDEFLLFLFTLFIIPGICARLGDTAASNGQEDIEEVRYVGFSTAYSSL